MNSLDSSNPHLPGAAGFSHETFLRLLFKHERQLESFVFALVADWGDAEDIIQETKVQLWEQFKRYDPAKDFGAWARTLAFYQVLSHRRRRGRSKEQPLGQQFMEAVAAEQETLAEESAARSQALTFCLKSLGDGSRQLVEQCYAGRETIKQVAERHGQTPGATYKALETIRRKLFDCIERKLRSGEVGA